jgi:hypothetical protein
MGHQKGVRFQVRGGQTRSPSHGVASGAVGANPIGCARCRSIPSNRTSGLLRQTPGGSCPREWGQLTVRVSSSPSARASAAVKTSGRAATLRASFGAIGAVGSAQAPDGWAGGPLRALGADPWTPRPGRDQGRRPDLRVRDQPRRPRALAVRHCSRAHQVESAPSQCNRRAAGRVWPPVRAAARSAGPSSVARDAPECAYRIIGASIRGAGPSRPPITARWPGGRAPGRACQTGTVLTRRCPDRSPVTGHLADGKRVCPPFSRLAPRRAGK